MKDYSNIGELEKLKELQDNRDAAKTFNEFKKAQENIDLFFFPEKPKKKKKQRKIIFENDWDEEVGEEWDEWDEYSMGINFVIKGEKI